MADHWVGKVLVKINRIFFFESLKALVTQYLVDTVLKSKKKNKNLFCGHRGTLSARTETPQMRKTENPNAPSCKLFNYTSREK